MAGRALIEVGVDFAAVVGADDDVTRVEFVVEREVEGYLDRLP